MSDRLPAVKKTIKTLTSNPNAACRRASCRISEPLQNTDDLPKELQQLASSTRDLCDALKKVA